MESGGGAKLDSYCWGAKTQGSLMSLEDRRVTACWEFWLWHLLAGLGQAMSLLRTHW